MKKLLTAAAMVALATPVIAQSTATVYGVIDTGVQSYNNGQSTFTRATDGILSTSRLGVRGSEDLGNGLKANFQLEGRLLPSNGQMGTTTTSGTTESTSLFDREAWVGLSGGFGEVRIGRQDVTAAQDVDTNTTQFGVAGFHATNGTAVELGVDQPNVVKYISPKVGGLSVQAGYAGANNNGVTTDTVGDQKGLAVAYEIGKATLYAGYQKNAGATKAAERDFSVVGAKYNLGFATVGASHAKGDTSTTGDVTSRVTNASVRVPLASGYALHGVYSVSTDGAQATANQGKGYTVGVSKTLSKRTTLYAAYTDINNQANAKMAMSGVTAPTTAGLDTKATAFGISHVF